MCSFQLQSLNPVIGNSHADCIDCLLFVHIAVTYTSKSHLCFAESDHCTILCCSGWSSTAGKCATASGDHSLAQRTSLALSHSLQPYQAAGRTHWAHSAWTQLSTPAVHEQLAVIITLHKCWIHMAACSTLSIGTIANTCGKWR